MNKLSKSQGGLPGSSPLRSDDSDGSQAGRRDRIKGGAKTLKGGSENNSRKPRNLLKNRLTAEKRVNLLLLRGCQKREMSTMMLMMMIR